jgi:hypothetical protein
MLRRRSGLETRRLAAATLVLVALVPTRLGAIDRGADGRFTQRSSMHFILLEDVAIDRDARRRQFERQVLDVLESAYDRVADEIGVRPRSKVRAVVYDPDVFDQSFGGLFPFRAAGFYSSAIHIRGASRLDTGLAKTLFHEYTHAALASEAPSYAPPGWVNEGLAEWIEALSVGQRGTSPGQRAHLAAAARDGRLPSLASLGAPSFSRLPPESAVLAYLYSHAAIAHLEANWGDRALHDFVQTLLRTRHLETALRRAFRLDLPKLEAQLRAALLPG